MSGDYSSGQTTINGTVTASIAQFGIPTLSAGQTLIPISGTGNASVQDAYTVTTGKTFYLFGYLCTSTANTTIYANDGSTIVGYLSGSTNAAAPVCSGVPIAAYTSGQKVKVNAPNTTKYFLWGIEQ